MRKIVAGMFITLDGVVEAPEKWNPPYYDDEMGQAVMPALAAAGLHLYGRLLRAVPQRVHRQGGSSARGDDDQPPKVVVSTTLDDPGWGPTTLIRSNVAAELTKLKQQPGQDISVAGSGTLVRFLLQAGLLDELRLLVHPVLAGAGKRLFEGAGDKVPLTLLDSRPHSNGVVALRYAPAA